MELCRICKRNLKDIEYITLPFSEKQCLNCFEKISEKQKKSLSIAWWFSLILTIIVIIGLIVLLFIHFLN